VLYPGPATIAIKTTHLITTRINKSTRESLSAKLKIVSRIFLGADFAISHHIRGWIAILA